MTGVKQSRFCQFPTLLVLWVCALLLFYIFYFGPYFDSVNVSRPFPAGQIRAVQEEAAKLEVPAKLAVASPHNDVELDAWWKWEDGAHPPGRPEYPFPHGPWDKLFIEHIIIDDDFSLAIGEDRKLRYMETGLADVMRWSERAMQFKRDWLMRILDFRHYLMKVGMDNTRFNGVKHTSAVPRLENSESPFFEAYLRNQQIFPETLLNFKPASNVVDHALVVPITTERYDEAWVTMESLMQQVTFPREIIIVLFKARGFYVRETFSFLTVLLDVYVKNLPDGVTMKVFVSPSAHCPGDTRWFAFNQTTAPIVTFFDGDDYLHPQGIQMLSLAFRTRPELHFALAQYKGGKLEGPFNFRMYYDEIFRVLQTSVVTESVMEKSIGFPNKEYDKLRELVPSWNKTWWLGNTDAEPNWNGEEQRWWDGGCHNGWASLRRMVMKYAPPPTKKFGGEDAIFNFRVAKSGFNYHCLTLPIGLYVKCFCKGDRYLWQEEPEVMNEETGEKVPQEHLDKLKKVVEEAMKNAL